MFEAESRFFGQLGWANPQLSGFSNVEIRDGCEARYPAWASTEELYLVDTDCSVIFQTSYVDRRSLSARNDSFATSRQLFHTW